MSQHDLTIANQSFPAFRSDLNNALQALGSLQSGTSAPSPTFANQMWYDTTNNILKIRNEDNDAWISVLTLDQSGDLLSAIGSVTISNIVQTASAQTFTSAQTFRAANAIRSEAASTQDAIVVAGRAGGSNSYATTLTPATLSANRTVTIPDETFTVGFRNIFAVGTKTGSYTLAVGDVGKYVQLGSGGSITIPTSTFAEGDAISLFNNTTGGITITCSAPTTYIAGTDTIKTSMTLATRGVATVLFISATLCVVSGNVS